MENTNWKSALNDYYSKSSGKTGFATGQKKSLPIPLHQYSELDCKNFGKFPPSSPPPLLLDISSTEFVKENLQKNYTSFSGNEKRDEIIAGIQFLEALLKTSTQKAVQHRSNLIELQKVIKLLHIEQRQRLLLSHNELFTVKYVIGELLTLKVASADLQNSDIRPEFATDSVLRTLNLKNLEDKLNKEDLLKVESAVYSLVERAHSLSVAVDSTSKCVEDLIEHCQTVYYFIFNPADDQSSKLKMIHIQWHQDDSNGWKECNRSYNYVAYMNSLSLPVCNEVCAYLQSPKDYVYGLLFPFGYIFTVNELAGIFNYFQLQHLLCSSTPTFSSYSVSAITKELVLSGCRLHDKDCHILANHLHIFPSLMTLDLSSNEVTSAGVSSIVAAVFTMGPACQLRYLSLKKNSIDCTGLAVIAEALRSGKSLMRLEMLSVAENPVKNKGICELLKSTMNKYRKAYQFLRFIKWHTLVEENELDNESEDETVEDQQQQQQAMNPILHNCYYSDYFHSSSIVHTHHNVNQAASVDSNNIIAGSWFTHPGEGFWLDDKSDYSSSHDDDSDEDDLLRRTVTEKVSSPQQPVKKKVPKLVSILIKLRVRLAAVNAFLRLRTRGHILSYLDISCCLMTKEIIRYIDLVLKDNHNLKVFDMSNNKVLRSKDSCREISNIFTSSALQTVKLNGCGITDEGLQEIAKGVAASETLRSVELSDNHFGPTGANWVASLSRRFYIDDLVLRNGECSTCVH